MRKTILTAAALALAITGFAGTSQAAQMYPHQGPQTQLTIQLGNGFGFGFQNRHRILSDREIRFALQRRGYHDIRILDRGYLRVTVRAEDFRGRDFRLVVSATTGNVISRVALRRGPFQHFGPNYGGGWNG